MSIKALPVILPSETKAREFDAKLMLACELALGGRRVFVGSRIAIHNAIGRFPRGIYLGKDFRVSSLKIFKILERLGHRILAWDEEGLVAPEPAEYLRRRLSAQAVAYLEGAFAWGEANAEILRSAPAMAHKPVHVSGNVRLDLARPKWRGFFADEVAALRAHYGDFILVNSSFAMVNHYLASDAVGKSASTPLIARDGPAQEVRAHRALLLGEFQAAIRPLAEAFPGHAIVVRPHPAEGHASWREAARGCANVHIVHEGNVYAWLMAARVMIHNGCSTAVESFVLQRPVIAFRPLRSAQFDLHLPNALSREIETRAALVAAIGGALEGSWGWAPTPEQRALARRYIANFDGPAAAMSIAATLDALAQRPPPPPWARLAGQIGAAIRAAGKRRNAATPGHKHSLAYGRHRFADTPLGEVRENLARLVVLEPRFGAIAVREIAANIFEIQANSAAKA